MNLASLRIFFLLAWLTTGDSFKIHSLKPSVGIEEYIVGGDVVNGRKFPAVVSIRVYGSHTCGGTIVNENYILTAAHCSHHSPEDMTVLAGTNNRTSGGTVHQVTEIYQHKDYNEYDSWHNDIAVMKVEPPFVFDAETAPGSLPLPGQEFAVGTKATVVGWGTVKYSGLLSKVLLKADIFISDRTECNKTYSVDYHKIYPEQLCADTPEGGKGSCQGDSGGPLYINNQEVGIVSWSRQCVVKGFPSVYTSVSHYIDWIKLHTGS